MRVEKQIDGIYLNTIARKLKWKIRTGDDYLWDCYPNARIMDFDDKESKDTFHVTVVFDPESLLVYEITGGGRVFRLTTEHEVWRWINPDYVEAFVHECNKRHIPMDRAWDDINYEDIDKQELLRRIDIVAVN